MRFLKIEKVSIVSAFIVIVTLFFSLIALAWIMKLACREAKEMKEESV
jgi:ABC-type multidrug transport system permease subunit